MKRFLQRRDFLRTASVGLIPLVGVSGTALAYDSSEAAGTPAAAAAGASQARIAEPQFLIDQAGPLPITVNAKIGSVGPATLFVSGSVWTQVENTRIGFEVVFDGKKVGEAFIFANMSNSHTNIIPVHIPIFLHKAWPGNPPQSSNPPTYSLALRPLPKTISDQNDHFQVVLFA